MLEARRVAISKLLEFKAKAHEKDRINPDPALSTLQDDRYDEIGMHSWRTPTDDVLDLAHKEFERLFIKSVKRVELRPNE